MFNLQRAFQGQISHFLKITFAFWPSTQIPCEHPISPICFFASMFCWLIVFVFGGQVGVQKEYASGEGDESLASDATHQEDFALSSVILPCVSTTFSSFHVFLIIGILQFG
jgi:hypothetical protein